MLQINGGNQKKTPPLFSGGVPWSHLMIAYEIK